MNIDTVFEHNDIVFVDSSMFRDNTICHREKNNTFLVNYSSKDIKEVLQKAKNFQSIMRHSKTATIPEVTREIQDFNLLLSKTIKRYLKPNFQKNTSTLNKIINNNLGKCEHIYDMIQKTQQTIFESYQLSYASEIITESEEKKGLSQILEVLDTVFRLKTSTYRGISKENQSKTDELLVIEAYLKSIYDNKKTAICTNDNDIIRLTQSMYKNLESNHAKYNIREQARTNPIYLYSQIYSINSREWMNNGNTLTRTPLTKEKYITILNQTRESQEIIAKGFNKTKGSYSISTEKK
ncbi:MAG: hypothetical protein ACQESC_01670 [Nanobdellota archaeon]